MDPTGEMTSIRPLISAGRLTALMPVLRAPALDITHLWMRSSSRHPRLGTGGLSRRASLLRTAGPPAGEVH